jgi:hypothetical protein
VIRAVFEKPARGEARALRDLAIVAGKTFVAVNSRDRGRLR